MKLSIETLKKLGVCCMIFKGIISLAILCKYDTIKTDKYIEFGKTYDWSK